MFAVYAAEPNPDAPLDALVVGERPDPDVPDGSVAVHVEAASLNMHDLWTLQGVGIKREQFPMILGCDGAGRLDDGTEVVIYPVVGDPAVAGDETLDPKRSLLTERLQGTFADVVVVPARNVVPRPAGLTAVAVRRDGDGLADGLPHAVRQVRAAAGADDARPGCVRRRVDGADPARPGRGHGGLGDRSHRGEAGARRQARRARHVPQRRAAAGPGGRGVRDRGRRHLGALDAGAEAGRSDRRLRGRRAARIRAPTCSDCSSSSCGSSARRWAPAPSSPTC